MLQRTIYGNHPSTGALVAREQQLVLDLLRLYRSGSSIMTVEDALRELRAVRKQIHESEDLQKARH